MPNNPPYQPTPVAVPTPTPYNLPNIPANAYNMLTQLADAIDTANSKLNGHASKLSDIHTSTNNAVNEVTTTSKGQATDTLAHLWGDSQNDLTHGHDKLLAITTAKDGIGPGPNDFRSTLDANKNGIQNGLIALAALQQQQSYSAPTVSPQQLAQWKQDIDTLDSSIANVNMALQVITMTITTLNNGFSNVCATGLIPGKPIPTFNQNAFAHQANGDAPGSGSSAADEQRLRNSLTNAGITGNQADILIMDAQGAGIEFNVISDLLDKGISGDTIKVLLADGNPELENLLTRKSQQNFDDFQAGKITQRQYNTKMQSINEIITSIYSKPEYVRSMADHNIKVADIYNAIDDSNVNFRMTPDNAITALTGPEGTARVEVAGPTGTAGDVKFYDDKGNLIFTRENKALTSTSRNGFNDAVRKASDEMMLQNGQHAEVFLQVQPGMNPTDIESWIKGYMGNRIKVGDAEKYRNVIIRVVDPSGNVIYAGNMLP